MDNEKENKRVQFKSKIPLPRAPLPPLPQIVSKRPQELEIERHPLKTINRQTIITGAIQKNENLERNSLKSKCPPKVDTRYVTLRQNIEDLDWSYQVFKDNVTKERSSAIIISDDEEDIDEEKSKNVSYFSNHNDKNCLGDTRKALTPAVTKGRSGAIIISDDEEDINEEKSKNVSYFTNHNDKNCLGDSRKALTPALKSPSLEPNRIKNIKKSLKRPHSRELQGISPKVQPDRGDERHKRRLEFTQLLQDGLHSPEYLDYTEDLFPYLLSIETKTAVPRISSKIRACIINWLIKVNGPSGNPAVIQTTQSYFDAVLAVCQVELNSLQLVAAACYWIAQKNHGSAFSARRLVKYSSEAFTVKNLLSAEKAVVYKLKFPSQPVVPQDFITYFSWYCDSDKVGEIEVAATLLCMAGLMVDKSLCNEYPSAIGAAAVRNAVLLLRRKDAMVRLQMNSAYKCAESKVSNISLICSYQMKAIRCMSSPFFKYKAPLEHYRNGPLGLDLIVQKVVNSANELSVVE